MSLTAKVRARASMVRARAKLRACARVTALQRSYKKRCDKLG